MLYVDGMSHCKLQVYVVIIGLIVVSKNDTNAEGGPRD